MKLLFREKTILLYSIRHDYIFFFNHIYYNGWKTRRSLELADVCLGVEYGQYG